MKRWFYVMLCVLLAGCVIPQQQYNPKLDLLDESLPLAVNGNKKEQIYLGQEIAQSQNRILPKLPDAGYRWLLAAAEAGDMDAQVSMGRLYQQESSSESEQTALYWYKRAARQGEYAALFALKNWNNGNHSFVMDTVEQCQWSLLAGVLCDTTILNAEQWAQAQTRADAWRANIKPEKPGNQAHVN